MRVARALLDKQPGSVSATPTTSPLQQLEEKLLLVLGQGSGLSVCRMFQHVSHMHVPASPNQVQDIAFGAVQADKTVLWHCLVLFTK